MKKIFCVLLSLLFIFSFTVSSFAATVTNSSGSASFDVKASYIAGTKSDTYSVDIVWGSMDFEYHAANEEWDPETHSYMTISDPYWSCANGANVITVTNHSSKPITAALSYTADTSYSQITAKFTPSAINLGVPTTSAPSGTSLVTLEGALPSSATNAKIGSITVTISPSSGTTAPAGYLSLHASVASDETDVRYDIYKQSDSIYFAEFTASAEAEASEDTTIVINNTSYYIYEAANAQNNRKFYFTPGSEVDISTQEYDDFEGNTYPKTTSVVAGTSYRLTIDLSSNTATLTEKT